MSRAEAARRPVPRPDGLGAEFYAHCARERLCFQRCDACGRWRHLPRHMCAGCGSPTWHWAESSGRGRLHSWTVTHAPLHPAFAAELPYVVAVVELEEGVRMACAVRGVAPEQLALDMPLEVHFEPVAEDVSLPCFRPAAGAGEAAR